MERKVVDSKLELVKDVGEGVYKGSSDLIKDKGSVDGVEEVEETLAVLNERILETSNGGSTKDVVTDFGGKKKTLEGVVKWPVVAAGSVGVVRLAAAISFVCHSIKYGAED